MQPALLCNIYFGILRTGSHTVALVGLEPYAALLPQPRVVGLQMCDCHHLWLILHVETKLFSKDSIFWDVFTMKLFLLCSDPSEQNSKDYSISFLFNRPGFSQ